MLQALCHAQDCDRCALAQFIHNLTGPFQRGNVTVAAGDLDIAPALTGNTPSSLRPGFVSAVAPVLVFVACAKHAY